MARNSALKNRRNNIAKSTTLVSLESLESRRLLSASAIVAQPLLTLSPDASGSTVQGYTPAQLAEAYGFNAVTLSGGVKGTGAGQTIAIVDAYNDPKISNDLGVFDSQFGLAGPPSFKVVSQSGSTTLPSNNASWDTEISLDVEWAHAMAPQANILLVEANSDSLTDLLSAVKYAAGASGISVVSMSWGGSEFSGENSDNTYFVTPSGHRGVTFVAASGDQGSYGGPEWPASSAYVLSVGGTTLSLNSSSAISSETGWSGSTGGVSTQQGKPEYQNSAQTGTARTSPDVAYDANPNTGVAVYDSVNYAGYVGWQEVGGTSEGAPQWAALIAIADQGRAAAGTGSLDGSTQTLPDLYALYNSSTTYANNFNDITSGSSGIVSAAKGYDQVTGLGSPKANAVVQSLIGDGSTSVALTTATITTTGGGGGGGRGHRRDLQIDPAAVIVTQNDAFSQSRKSSSHAGNFAATNHAGSSFTAGFGSANQLSITTTPSAVFSGTFHNFASFQTADVAVKTITLQITPDGFSPASASVPANINSVFAGENLQMIFARDTAVIAAFTQQNDSSNQSTEVTALLGSAIVVGMYVANEIQRKQAAIAAKGDGTFGLQLIGV
jgi:subtilase family serine protease